MVTKSTKSKTKPTTTLRHDRRFRIVAFDLDSSVFGGRRECTDKDVAFVRELQNRGMVVTMATNRCTADIKDYILKLDPKEPIPIITDGGSKAILCHVMKGRQIYNGNSKNNSITNEKKVTEQLLFEDLLDKDIVQAAVKAASRRGYMTLYYHGDSIYANPKLASHFACAENLYKTLNKELVFVGDDFYSLLQQPECIPDEVQILAVPSLDKIFKRIDDDIRERCFVQGYDRKLGGNFIQVVNPNATKGRAVSKLFQRLGLPTETCIVTGFNGDDLDNLIAAGFRAATKSFLDQSTKTCLVAPPTTTRLPFTRQGSMKDLRRLDKEGMLWSD